MFKIVGILNPFRLRRPRLGWKPNLVDHRDWDFETLGLSAANTRTVSLRHLVSQVLSQKNTSSCVAHAVAGAIDVLETKAGLPYVPPSRLFLYFNARRYHSKSVTDSGTYIRTCIKGLLKAGVPDEKYWPFSTSKSKINRRPGWEPYMKAFSRRDGEYYAIRSSGSARIASIKAALSDGYPVAFGTPVAKSFLSSSGPHVVDKPSSADTIVGGHAMLIVGYKEDAGRVLFEVLNSWGTRYRDDGYVWLTDDYIKWRLTNDLTIIKGWKRLKNARRAA